VLATYAGWASVAISVYGYLPYVFSIIRGNARPDRPAWFIWTIEYGVILAALVAKHAPLPALALVGVQWLGVAVVFGLSLWRGMGQADPVTVLTLVVVAIGLVAWWKLQDSLIALIISLAIETIGIVFVVIKTIRVPESETYTVWLCAALAGLFGTVAVAATPGAGLVLYLYPVVLLLINAAVVVAKVCRSPKFRFRSR